MAFNICPDDGPPRLWRFVSRSLGDYEGRQIVALLLKGNILTIDKELYDQLLPMDQHRLLRTHHSVETV